MSAVKNLRAMFEQKGDSTTQQTSPPDRGRSPGISSVQSTGSNESPRPLSKVRTSFIAVEKDGRIGLQRDPSRDSSVSVRKFSGENEGVTPPALQEKTNVFAEKMAKATSASRTNIATETIPESPRQDTNGTAVFPPVKRTTTHKLEAPGPNPDKHTDAEEPNTRMVPGGPTDKAVISENGTIGSILPSGGFGETLNGTGGGKSKGKEKEPAKPTKLAVSKAGPSSSASRAAPLNAAASRATTSKPAKSPTVARAPKSPATATTPKLPTKTPEKKAVDPQKTSTPRTTATAAAGPSSAAKPASTRKPPPPLTASPASTGFVKPKPKSPTRPVRLPASLTTHTASSGQKVSIPRQTLSRASGTIHSLEPPSTVGRSPSRTSVSTAGGSAPPRNLRRQSSTINRPRPSLGPPPKQPARDHPPTRHEKEVDEGFLARMMRPTQASSSKLTEKTVLPTTPPRKAPAAPAAHAAKKPVRKIVPRAALAPASASSSAPAPAPAREAEPAEEPHHDDVVEVAEHAETAEEIIEAAQEAEGEVALPAEAAAESVPEEEADIEEVAPVVEQQETAEAIIEIAKGAEGEVAIPEEELAAEPEPVEVEKNEEVPEVKVNGDHAKLEAEEEEVQDVAEDSIAEDTPEAAKHVDEDGKGDAEKLEAEEKEEEPAKAE